MTNKTAQNTCYVTYDSESQLVRFVNSDEYLSVDVSGDKFDELLGGTLIQSVFTAQGCRAIPCTVSVSRMLEGGNPSWHVAVRDTKATRLRVCGQFDFGKLRDVLFGGGAEFQFEQWDMKYLGYERQSKVVNVTVKSASDYDRLNNAAEVAAKAQSDYQDWVPTRFSPSSSFTQGQVRSGADGDTVTVTLYRWASKPSPGNL